MRPDEVDLIRLKVAWKDYQNRKDQDKVRPQDTQRVVRELWNLRTRFGFMDANDLLHIAARMKLQAQDLVPFDTMLRQVAFKATGKRSEKNG